MSSFIATYDLKETNPDGHSIFLKHARRHGWNYWIQADDDALWYRLPNTTLEGSFSTREDALSALRATLSAAETELGRQLIMTKWIVADYNRATFNSDTKSDR